MKIQKSPNLKIFQDYNLKLYDYKKRRIDVKKFKKEKDKIKKVYDNLCNKRKIKFLKAFQIISTKLKEMYQMIAIGGDAELEIIDSSEIFNEGILFSVRPPKKSWKHIQNLSGVFALHYFKPNPIYFMDEIDAALDFKNVSIISHYIKTKTNDAQFIVISLRNQMFELCDRMIGIYKTNDITKCITMNPNKGER
uniref:RecF/RecN/SMC N-terminal domain-containing protein n=1 Tax=Piliocolobus tephrosceles TaxID=591936 RepID=A0A8C9GI24_9PRIM